MKIRPQASSGSTRASDRGGTVIDVTWKRDSHPRRAAKRYISRSTPARTFSIAAMRVLRNRGPKGTILHRHIALTQKMQAGWSPGRLSLERHPAKATELESRRYFATREHSPRQLSSAISLWALLALVGFFTQAVRFTNDRRRFYRFIRWRAEVVRRIPRAHHHRRAGIIVVLFTRYQPMSDGPWYAYLQCDSSLRSKSSVNLNILATRSLKTRVPIRLCWKLQHTRGMCPHEAIYPITPERRDIDVADIDRGMFGARVRLLASRRFASATKNARPR